MADGDNVQPIRPGMAVKATRAAMVRAAQANLSLATMHVVRWSEAAIGVSDGVSEIMLQHAIQEVCDALTDMQTALKRQEPAPDALRSMLAASLAVIEDEPQPGPDAA